MKAFSFLIALGLNLICFCVLGASLGLFLAGFFTLTLLLPPLMLTQGKTKRRIATAACVGVGTAVVWLVTVYRSEVTLMQWLKSCVVLIGFATSLAGVSVALVRLRINPLAASAIAVALWLIWLTAPVWLASSVSDAGVARLVWIHPIFAINGLLSNLGTWSHFPIAYRQLTTLGQDIPYTLPTSIWPATLIHLIPGIALWWVGSSKPSAAAEPSEAGPSSAAGRS